MENLLISACLLGVRCRYDGESCPNLAVEALLDQYNLIPVCPEQMGGLPTPRDCAERQGNTVMSNAGCDVTQQYRQGAEQVLQLARLFSCTRAVLKERSPSCGSGEIYDGSFSGTKREGDGVTAELLKENGIRVYGESEIWDLLE